MIIVGFGALAVFRLLTPEMYVRLNHRPRFEFPWGKPRLLADSVSEVPVQPESLMENLPIAIDMPMQADEMPAAEVNKTARMEILLLEKNKAIEKLQKELQAERSNRSEFDKVKAIMDEEIGRLKDQVRSLKQVKEQRNA